MVIGVAGSAFSVWLTRWQQFSVVPHQSISLFYISDNKVEISPVQFLCIPWFAFYLRKLDKKSRKNPLLSHPCAIPSLYPFILNWLSGFMSRESGLYDLLIAFASDSDMGSHIASKVLPFELLCVHVLVSGSYRRQAMLFQSKSLYSCLLYTSDAADEQLLV